MISGIHRRSQSHCVGLLPYSCPPKRGGETTFPDKLKYTSTALRSITTDPNEPLSAVFVRAPILKRVGGAALPSLAAAAIFHSQTSFLRRENRKSGACYNKRQYCITQKRARDTGRGTPSLGMQHSAGRSLAPRCGIRDEERDTKEFRHGAQACAHGQAAFALSEAAAARNAHCCDLFKRRFKRQRAGDGVGGSFALFSAAVKKKSARYANKAVAPPPLTSSVRQKEFLRHITKRGSFDGPLLGLMKYILRLINFNNLG